MTQRVALPFFGLDPLPHKRPLAATFGTWLNQSSGVTNASIIENETDANNAVTPLILSGAADSADYRISALLKSAPSNPFTITTLQAAWGGGSILTYPIILRDSVHDKNAMLAWNASAGGSTVKNSVVAATLDDTSPGTQESPIDDGFHLPPFLDYVLWFRATVAGSTIGFSHSPDGVVWEDLAGFDLSSYFSGAIDKVGFGIQRASAGANSGLYGIQRAILWKWDES